jgi:hypothetical protein
MTDFDPPLEFDLNSSAIPPHQIPSCPFPSIVFPLIYPIPRGIFENKCGGIRVGINYSASVLIDGNTIRDHTGPGVYAINLPKQSTKFIEGENDSLKSLHKCLCLFQCLDWQSLEQYVAFLHLQHNFKLLEETWMLAHIR